MSTVFQCGRFSIPLDRPKIMGIVNVTPDSFSDGGQHDTAEQAIAHAKLLISQGADILDIGGESTRPGAAPVSVEEELQRVLPVLRGVMDLGVPISIDTRRPQVMKEAVALGVDLLNDINGFRDPQAFEAAVNSSCGLCIMHMLGEPRTMQDNPQYSDVVGEVTDFLMARCQAFVDRGVDRRRLLIDPGFGFGKSLEHNLALMRAIGQMAAQQPILVGVSRKRMIAGLLGQDYPPDQRVTGSVVAALWAADQGAQILRVHDVQETAQALAVWSAIKMPA
ncbi:dihydropteroate synthase [beta proteobacterium MWH-UniP1]